MRFRAFNRAIIKLTIQRLAHVITGVYSTLGEGRGYHERNGTICPEMELPSPPSPSTGKKSLLTGGWSVDKPKFFRIEK